MRSEILLTSVWVLLVIIALMVGCMNSEDEKLENNAQTSLGETPEGPAPENQQTISEDPSGEIIIHSEMRRGMDTAFTEACSGKKPGETCTLNTRNTSVSGLCMDRNGTLTCQLAMPPSSKTIGGPGGMGTPRMNRTPDEHHIPPEAPGEPTESP